MKFSYVQIGCRDCRALADFYINALDFQPCDASEWLLGKEGITLRAPGFEDPAMAPVFGFVPAAEGSSAKINDAGYAHVCFETTSVKAAVKRLVKNGGGFVSTMKNPQIHPCVYCKDPEGNVVEFHIPFPSGTEKGEKARLVGSLLGLVPNSGLKFIHVNVITSDWEKMIAFYQAITPCRKFGKLKDHQGSYKSQVIGIPDVHVVGQHILMEGFCSSWPTFEVFSYSIPGRAEPCSEKAAGLNLIGFSSDHVEDDAAMVAEAGGKILSLQNGTALAEDLQGGRILIR